MKKLYWLTVIFFAAIVVGLSFLTWSKQEAKDLSPRLFNTKLGGDFILASTLGKPLDTLQLRGNVVLLTFGYAECRDICPLGLMRLHEVIQSLGQDASKLSVIFVAFDSEQDLSKLARYIHGFDSNIIGVAGSEQEISEITSRYGVIYPKKLTSSDKPNFDHNGFIYLLDTQGKVRAIYPNNMKIRDIIKDIKILQK